MNGRALFTGLLAILGIAGISSVWVQQHRIGSLQRTEEQTLAQLKAQAAATESKPTNGQSVNASLSEPPLKLLELRGQATRLMRRERELARTTNENQELRTRVAGLATNSTGLPRGYQLRSQAQWQGLDTPEHTLESFQWAVEHQDLSRLFETLTPEMAEDYRSKLAHQDVSKEALFKALSIYPGLRMVKGHSYRDYNGRLSFSLKVQAIPGEDWNEWINFRQTNGVWKAEIWCRI